MKKPNIITFGVNMIMFSSGLGLLTCVTVFIIESCEKMIDLLLM